MSGKRRKPTQDLSIDLTQQLGGMEVVSRVTESIGHAEILAKEACEQGFERVIAMGGDGTIHEVLNGKIGRAHV